MDTQHEKKGGKIALVIGHCAGLMDITSLPVWVGIVLIGRLGLEPQRAGALVTLFLGAVVVSSTYFAPRLNRVRRRRLTPLAYALAGLSFAAMPGIAGHYATLAILHVAAGLSVGCGLSMVHGTMGGTANPHRTSAIAFTTLSVVSITFLATMPTLIERTGPELFFYTMSGIMFTAAVATLIAFPSSKAAVHGNLVNARIPARVWFGIAGVSLLMVTHSMVFGFIERIAGWHGFDTAQITLVLIVSGIVNLFPAAAAGLLERRLPVIGVICAGPLIQGAAALLVTQGSGFPVFLVGTSILIAILTFTHIFAFGLLARRDPSGRVVAATPMMVMAGSAIGPILGGVLAQHVGYGSLGWVATAICILSAACFFLLGRDDKCAIGSRHIAIGGQG